MVQAVRWSKRPGPLGRQLQIRRSLFETGSGRESGLTDPARTRRRSGWGGSRPSLRVEKVLMIPNENVFHVYKL